MAWPRKATVPESGRNTPDRRLSTVVLPEPLGPSRPTISPAVDREAQRIDGQKAAEAAAEARDLEQRAHAGFLTAPSTRPAMPRGMR